MRYLWYYGWLVIVVIEVVLSLVIVLWVALTVMKGTFQKRSLAYLYELGLLVLFCHFIWRGPFDPSGDWVSVLYWSSQVGLGPFVLLPFMLESKLWRRRARRAILLSICGSILSMLFAAYATKTFGVRWAEVQRELHELRSSAGPPVLEERRASDGIPQSQPESAPRSAREGHIEEGP